MDLYQVETYLQPRDLRGVQDWRPGWAWLAGGTWLFSEAQPDIKTFVDLEPLQWADIEETPDAIAIGAMVTFSQLENYGWRSEWIALRTSESEGTLKQAIAALSASFKVTQVATIGGNLCLALAVGIMAPIMVTLNARYELWHPSGTCRFVNAIDFQLGIQHTVLEPGEVLRRVWLPKSNLTWKTDFQRFGVAATDPALCLVVSAIATTSIRCCLGACVPAPYLLEFSDRPSNAEILNALENPAIAWLEDYRASALYRKHLAYVLLKHSLENLSS